MVVRGTCEAIAAGRCPSGRRINERALAVPVQLSTATVSDALRQLAEDEPANQDAAGRFETYTRMCKGKLHNIFHVDQQRRMEAASWWYAQATNAARIESFVGQ